MAIIFLLTSKDSQENVVEGLRSGADDYLTKPFSQEELEAHLETGIRILGFQRKLMDNVTELSEANARLKELDQLKSMFIASMSHELRTPLNSIIGFTGIILQGMSGEVTKEQENLMDLRGINWYKYRGQVNLTLNCP